MTITATEYKLCELMICAGADAFTGNGDGRLNPERGIERQRIGYGAFIQPVGLWQAPNLYDSDSDGLIDRLMLHQLPG